MFFGRFGNGSEKLIGVAYGMRDVDVDDLSTPGLRWRDHPDEKGKHEAC